MKPILIESQNEFDQHYPALSSEPHLAVDTEFFREVTYFPHLGLVQVANSKIVACIDPLAFDARSSIASLLLNPDITNVFHSCSQDLEVLKLYLGELPCPVEDTQIAASLCSDAEQVGYANLVKSELDVELDKSQTRTNWLKRPLTSKQLEYAADDVIYLFQLIEKQSKTLVELGRKDWFIEDCKNLCSSPQAYEPNLSDCGRRVKGTNKLPSFDLAIVNAIALWREKRAIDKDKTRRHVMPDNDIIILATTKPETLEQLKQIEQLSRYLSSDELKTLLVALKNSYLLPESEWPTNKHYRLDPEAKKQLRKLQDLVDSTAENLNISASTLCSRKELTSLFNGNRDCRVLSGWRADLIGNALISLLE